VEESGLKQLNKAPEAKVPDTFLRREAGLDELLDMSFDIMDQGSRQNRTIHLAYNLSDTSSDTDTNIDDERDFDPYVLLDGEEKSDTEY
jgi:hypothetical protein